MIEKDNIKPVFESHYVKVYDMNAKGDHSYNIASRRQIDDLPARRTKEEYQTLLPDAVSIIAILKIKGEEPKLVLSKEYRYPAGDYILSVPAGLIDPEDKEGPNPLETTAIRELKEETGLEVQDGDIVKVVSPFLFVSPGITDEANALVYVEINRDQMPAMTQDGAVGMEHFNGFCIIDKTQAQEIIERGRDDQGLYYPVWTWAAIMWFLGVR